MGSCGCVEVVGVDGAVALLLVYCRTRALSHISIPASNPVFAKNVVIAAVAVL
jgi:hypothetical protein